jgi:hypothetical protein
MATGVPLFFLYWCHGADRQREGDLQLVYHHVRTILALATAGRGNTKAAVFTDGKKI